MEISMTGFKSYQSTFSWRYGSDEMRQIWSEFTKRLLWRKIWVAVAQVQTELGLVSPEQVNDLRAHAEQVDIDRALEIEKEIHHDLMAELRTFAEQAIAAGGILHLGMTSMDVVDNADVLRIQQSLDLILDRLNHLLDLLAEQIEKWASTPVMAFTHLQPAEPSTLGYRLAVYGQDLLIDRENLLSMRSKLHAKGFKGAVGTSASFVDLLGKENVAFFEQRLSELLGLSFFPVTTQVYTRKQDYDILSALAGLGASMHKLAFDLRFLQSPPVGEMSEPFGDKQVGSSAMPFKRNPIQSEKIDSLARLLAQYPRVAWDNAALSLLERTLDDSANRRTILPEAFLMADELLLTGTKILNAWVVHEAVIARNLEQYGPFAATEGVLMALAKAGADRQAMHERLRDHALKAWSQVMKGEPNPLAHLVQSDEVFQEYLSPSDLQGLMQERERLGLAPERAHFLAKSIRQAISSGGNPS
jgi:adenylosuccinate lyase